MSWPETVKLECDMHTIILIDDASHGECGNADVGNGDGFVYGAEKFTPAPADRVCVKSEKSREWKWKRADVKKTLAVHTRFSFRSRLGQTVNCVSNPLPVELEKLGHYFAGLGENVRIHQTVR